jgi:hypothetical protein
MPRCVVKKLPIADYSVVKKPACVACAISGVTTPKRDQN